jgi:hypothetical protein
MPEDYPAVRQRAIDALEAGDARGAFGAVRQVLGYPTALDESQWPEAMAVFARIASAIVGEEWAGHVRAVADAPSDVRALYKLGYELIEQSLHSIAAAVLDRANRLAPEQQPIVSELVSALEDAGLNERACQVLRESPRVLGADPLCQYLLGFNALMTADLRTPRDVLAGAPASVQQDERLGYMFGQLRQMLDRADALLIAGASKLDDRDLRGWHFVINGSALLHLSPYGFDAGMNGRYAYIQDSASACHEAVQRLAAVLNEWQAALSAALPRRIFLLPDRESAALGTAAARVLGVPAEAWPVEGCAEPGLIVAYDLGKVPDEVLRTFREHRAGQLLWGHAACWTRAGPISADLVTYLYQVNLSPWEPGRLKVGAKGGKVESAAAVEGTPAMLADSIVSTQLEESALADLPRLRTLARAAAGVSGAAAGGAFLPNGAIRRRQRADSPVKSSRFE